MGVWQEIGPTRAAFSAVASCLNNYIGKLIVVIVTSLPVHGVDCRCLIKASELQLVASVLSSPCTIPGNK